jgi:hypothetical protein
MSESIHEMWIYLDSTLARPFIHESPHPIALHCLLKDNRQIGCKWVLKVMHDVDEYLNKYSHDWLLWEYAQTYIIDYEKPYNLIVKMTIMKAIIVMDITNIPLHLMDVNNIFLCNDLQEVNMEQPLCCIDYAHYHFVYTWTTLSAST